MEPHPHLTPSAPYSKSPSGWNIAQDEAEMATDRTASSTTIAFRALPTDIRTSVESVGGNPPKPMSTMEIMLAIGQAIAGERQRCAEYARAYLEDIAGCDMKEDEPERIASGILAGGDFVPPRSNYQETTNNER